MNSLIARYGAKLARNFQLALTFLGRGDGYLKESHPFLAIPSSVPLGNVARNGKTRPSNLIPQHSVPTIIAAFS